MIVDSTLTMHVDELTPREWSGLFRRLSFVDGDGNPWECFQWMKGHRKVRLPRGAWCWIPDKTYAEFVDARKFPKQSRHKFLITLDADDRFKGQAKAVSRMFAEEQGLIIRPPGTGKTQIALSFCAQVGTRILVLVHTEDIRRQWVDYAERAIPSISVGTIGGGQYRVKQLTIATVQTYIDHAENLADKFGAILIDECHHAPAATWEHILNQSTAKYRFGFTATEKRADGREPLMEMLLGPVIHRLDFEPRVPVKVLRVDTGFQFDYRGAYDWTNLLRAIELDESRNELIALTAIRQIAKGHSTLVLSRRIKHLEQVRESMMTMWAGQRNRFDEQVKILTGRISKSERADIIEKFRAGEITCLLATQLADEALDVPILSRVLLTFPGKHEGRIIQQIGRALREHPDKDDALIFDFVDDDIETLGNQWNERNRTYRKLGIKVKKQKGEPHAKEAHRDQGQRKRGIRHLVPRRSTRGARSG